MAAGSSGEISIDARQLRAAAAALARARASITPALRVAADAMARQATRDLRAATPRSADVDGQPEDKPHAQDRWAYRPGPDGSIGVTNAAPYLPFLFTGTQAHFIAPLADRTGANGRPPALRFSVGGGFAFSRGHEVSGIAVNQGLVDALDQQRVKDEAAFRALGLRLAAALHAAVEEAGR